MGNEGLSYNEGTVWCVWIYVQLNDTAGSNYSSNNRTNMWCVIPNIIRVRYGSDAGLV